MAHNLKDLGQKPIQSAALLLLAAGSSKRFGADDKLLAPLFGKPVMRRVIDNLAAINFAARFAVIRPQALDENYALKTRWLKQAGFTCLENSAPQGGLSSSRLIGLSTLHSAGYRHICLCLADMPFVPGTHIQDLLQAGETKDAIFSFSFGRRLPPALLGPEAISQFLAAPNLRPENLSGLNISEIPLTQDQARDIDRPTDLIGDKTC